MPSTARPATAREVAAALASAPEEEALDLIERYAEDPRRQVRHAIEVARRRLEREREERGRVEASYRLMRELGGEGVILGVDEVGRGALAGPLTVSLRQAMASAIADAGVEPDRVLIDGNPVHVHPRETCVVKGDARVACISAASIVAKVARDAIMVAYEDDYPGYHLAESKGYGSAEHISAIRARGLTPIHRVSFCGNFLETPRLF